ncbi:MAG TPA: zinc-ribbon and DUF3426 domain-containing protein [Burkholderiales bacterium]|nr:zinc-ribbon and DUF3426 domain-containing protein [Burkholderiales bacterium]
MSIVTRCPGCGTTFRVTPVQLQAQHGMVRCGRCAQVFDGFKTLATLPEPALETPAQALESTPKTLAPSAAPMPPATPVVTPASPAVPAAVAAAPAQAAKGSQPASTPITSPPPRTEIWPDEPSEPVDERLKQAPSAPQLKPPRRHARGWAVGVAVMLFALAAQAAYFFRSDIAASLPEARPQLSKLCELLRCTVALPQRPRQISIEASDMQAPDPANPGLIALTATMRNHATTALGYPALDVVLTNTKEHTVARRIFLPAEYLAAGKDPRAGIAPNAEVTIRLDLDTGDLGAAGFRLDLGAAPAR